MSGAINGGVPFTQQSDALRQRLGTLLPSDGYTDTLGEVNNWGFAVAGAKKDSLLQSIGQALLQDQIEGRDVKHFQRQFAAIVTREGWTYRGPIGWRSRVIFETNLGQSREAGKWRQIAEAVRDGREFWVRYVATMDGATRPQHAAWNGTTLPPDNAWWRTHAPKNGWRCRCTVLMVSPGMLAREGWKVSDSAPQVELEDRVVNTANGTKTVRVPKGIDTGFGHNSGQRPLDGVIPRPARDHPLTTLAEMTNGERDARPRILERPSPVPPAPAPRPIAPNRILPGDMRPEAYVERFLAEFGGTLDQPARFTDALGSDLIVGARMFRDQQTDAWKITKQGRAPTILLCADALREPDEVWASMQAQLTPQGKSYLRLVRTYIAWLEAPDRARSGFAVFEHGPDGWLGITAYEPRAGDLTPEAMRSYLEGKRRGILLYRRNQDRS